MTLQVVLTTPAGAGGRLYGERQKQTKDIIDCHMAKYFSAVYDLSPVGFHFVTLTCYRLRFWFAYAGSMDIKALV